MNSCLQAVRRSSFRPDTVTLAVLAITALGLALRIYDLGERAMHHDESLHAMFAWHLAEGHGYWHDPLTHGPLQFHLIAGLFRLLGDGEVTARLPAALAGGILVATPLLLRRWLGGTGTVATAILLSLSPSLLYFSRFARNDALVALWTLLLITAVWRYREKGGLGWLALLAAALALSFSTKETAYLTAAMLLLYLDATLAYTLLSRRGKRGCRRVLEAAMLLPSAWLIAAGWRALAGRLGCGARPREVDLLVVTGTLTLPFLAALLPTKGLLLERLTMVAPPMDAVLLLLAGSIAVRLAWSWRWWIPLAVLFVAIVAPLYTTGFTNADGFLSGLWGSLEYWLAQQEVRRGAQPGFYYLMMLPLYEFLMLLPALAGGAWLLWRGDRLVRLLAWWFVATLVSLSLAGEKMPWLTVHLALPLALLAGHTIGVAAPAVVHGMKHGHASLTAGAGATMVVGVPLLALSLYTASGVVYAHSDTPLEPLIYTQTTPDVPALMREIESFAESRTGRDELVVIVDTTSSFAWPWSWYLRHFPRTSYVGPAAIAEQATDNGVVIVASSTLASQPNLKQRFSLERTYRHRWWFPEGRYKSITTSKLLDGLRNRSLLSDWVEFYTRRIDSSVLVSIDGAVLFPDSPQPP